MKKFFARIALRFRRFRNRRFLRRIGQEWWDIDSSGLRYKNLRSCVLPGGFSDNPSSELYIRPDKDHPAREWKWSYRRLEALVDKGRTKPFSKPEMRMYRDRLAYYEQKYGEA